MGQCISSNASSGVGQVRVRAIEIVASARQGGFTAAPPRGREDPRQPSGLQL